MRRICIFLLLIIFSICCFPSSAFAISAQSAVLIDATSGRVLFSHNKDLKLGMASTTKIMTAITAIENAELGSVATVSPTAYGVEGSSMYLGLGEKLTLEELLWGLMLVSGNDAATAVAEHVSGSVQEFAELMNKTAQKIGAENSAFTNPHGLSDDNHYTTAHDLAKITAYALKNAKFREIVSSRSKKIPWAEHDYDRYLVNHNKFLTMYEGCIGVKTGFTKATGRCLVTAVEKNGLQLVCVTLNAPDDWNDHKVIYDTAFSEYSPYTIKSQGELLSATDIKNGTTPIVNLTTGNDIIIPIRSGEETKIETISTPFEDLCAPVKKGDVLGTLTVTIDGNPCSEFPLVAAEDVELKKVIFMEPSGKFGLTLKKVFNSWIHCFD